MSLNNTVIIVAVVAFAFYLIYSQNNNKQKNVLTPQNLALIKAQLAQSQNMNQPMQIERFKQTDQVPVVQTSPYAQQPIQMLQGQAMYPGQQYQANLPPVIQAPQGPQVPQVTNVTIEQDQDPYSDAIKKQDLYSIYDPLTYPQYRLPREILEKYNEYYERNGSYPPFGQATQPLFDNPTLNGLLIKIVDENEPFTDNVPNAVPLFRVRSSRNTNRYFYYVLDQRYLSKVELKIPLDNVKLNGVRYHNVDYNGLPEIFDDDIICDIPIYPCARFKVLLYKTYHFP